MAEGVELATAYVTIIPSLKGATKQIESQLAGVDTSKAGSTIGKKLGGSIGKSLDLSAIGAGLSDAGQKLADVGGKLTAGITVPLVGATAAAGTFALRTASAAETTEISFTTMLGSAEAALDMMDELADFAAHTPFELSGLQTATRQLLAYGFTAEDVIPMLTAVGDATAALGTGQQGIESVTRALGQMQTRGKVSAEEMLQLTEAGIPAWEYLARAIGTDTAGAMEAVSDGAVSASEGIAALTKGMEQDFGGMMEEQSKTVAGLFSNLSDAIEQPLMKLRESDAYERFADSLEDVVDSAGPFVESLLPHMEDGLDAVSGVLDSATDAMDAFADMGEEGQSQLIGMATAAAAAGPVLTVAGKGMQALGSATKGAGSLIQTGAKLVGGLGDKLLDFATAPATASTALGKLAGAAASIPTPVTVAAGVIGGLAVAAIGAMAAEAAEAAEHEALLADATTSASDIMSAASGSASGLGDAIGGIATDAEGTLRALADLNDEAVESLSEVSVDSAMLDQYLTVIDELANKSGLTATEQYRLSEAVEGFNKVTGESYSVVDAANGKMADQNGVLQENTDQLHASADAWKQRAQSEALSNVATKYLEAEAEAAYDLSVAQSNLAAAQDDYNDTLERMRGTADKTSEEYQGLVMHLDELKRQMPGLEQEVSDLAAAHEDAADKADEFSSAAAIESAVFDELGDDASGFVDSIGDAGISLSDFASLTDDQMSAIAKSWDGSAESIIDAMADVGVEVPQSGIEAMLGLETNISQRGARAISAALRVSDLTVEQFASMVDEYGITGSASITRFAEAIANGDTYDVAARKAREAQGGLDSGDYRGEGTKATTEYNSGVQSVGTASAARSRAQQAASAFGDANYSGVGSTATNSFSSGIRSASSRVSSAASAIAAQARSMGNVDTYSSGQHLSSNLANGIRAAKYRVTSAARAVMKAAASIMRFSVPEDGPFSGSERGGETSGRHLVENFASGMEGAIGDVRRASEDVAEAARVDATQEWGAAAASWRSASPAAYGAERGTEELLAELLRRLPSMIRDNSPSTMTVEGREFARAVRRAVRA